MKAVKMGFSLFALFLTPIWAIAKKSWLALVIILIAIIINVACQMLLSTIAFEICRETDSSFAPDWIGTTAYSVRLGIFAITSIVIGIFGGNIRIWELKIRGYAIEKEVNESSESTALESELLSGIKKPRENSED